MGRNSRVRKALLQYYSHNKSLILLLVCKYFWFWQALGVETEGVEVSEVLGRYRWPMEDGEHESNRRALACLFSEDLGT